MNGALIAEVLAFVTPLLKVAFGNSVPVDAAAKLLAHATDLFSLGHDLTDGDLHLSQETRAILSNLILDLKENRL